MSIWAAFGADPHAAGFTVADKMPTFHDAKQTKPIQSMSLG